MCVLSVQSFLSVLCVPSVLSVLNVYPNWEFEMWSDVSYEYLDTYNILCVMSYYNLTLLRYKERKQLTLATAEAEKRMRNAGIFVKSET